MHVTQRRKVAEPGKRVHTGRLRLEITVKYTGRVVFHEAGPANIVYGLYTKFLEGWDADRHG